MDNKIRVSVDDFGRIPTSYFTVALTGDVRKIKKAIRELAKTLKTAFFYGYTDKNGDFQVKTFKDLFKRKKKKNG